MFACTKCEREFESIRALNAHQIAHKEGKRYSVRRKNTKKVYFCITCGIEKTWRHSQKNKFCSISCQHKHQYNEKIKHWKDGNSVSNCVLKRFLLEKQEGCWNCGITSWQDKEIVLELEHIDGNFENNQEENLSLLCPNCHSQTKTYKGKNRGKGRHFRRKRYAEGKSY